MATKRPNTPGYNIHLQIFFQADRNGRKIAYRWSPMQTRAFRMGVADAELFVAQGQATQIDGHPLKNQR